MDETAHQRSKQVSISRKPSPTAQAEGRRKVLATGQQKRGKQALIEKVRSERQMALEKTGVTLLPGTSLLPRKEVVDVEEDETDTEEGMEEANSDAERPEGTAPTAH